VRARARVRRVCVEDCILLVSISVSSHITDTAMIWQETDVLTGRLICCTTQEEPCTEQPRTQGTTAGDFCAHLW
jgi:hypothetical protein